MQALKKTFKQIADSLGRLPTNAKLLIGALMIILVMALFLVSQYAGRTDMAALGLPNSGDVRTRVVRHLDQSRIPYQDRGGDIYVPVSQRYTILGQLNEQQIVNADQIDFNKLIDLQTNPFISAAQARQMWLTAKMNVLSAMIAARQDVASARVIIDEPQGSIGFGRAHIAPTASVVVTMRGAPLTQEVADVIGHLVAGAHAGLKASNVTVTDVASSRRFVPRDGDALAQGSYLEHKKSTEEHFRRSIEHALRSVPGAIVTVNAVIKNTLEETQERRIDDPKIGPQSSESRDYQATNVTAQREPGVRSNAGAAITGGGRTSQITESVTKDQRESVFPHQDRIIHDPTGYPLQVNALVSIPRSHFVNIFRTEEGDPQAEPSLAALDPIIQRETQQWEEELAILIATKPHEGAVAGEVRVRMVHDFDVADLGGPGSGTGGPGGAAAASGLADAGLIRNIGLVALALLSVVMMFLMVKRANARQELPSAAELAGLPPELRFHDSDLIGEAEEGEPVLEGIELDDSTMRAQQLLDQINSMIQEGPEDAAGLFERWIAAQTA